MVVRILIVFLMLLLTVFSGVVFFSNMDYFRAIDSGTSVVVTFGFFVLLTIVYIIIVSLDKGIGKRALLCTIVVFVMFAVIPVRGLYSSADFEPLEDINVELVDCKTTYRYSKYTTTVKLKLTQSEDYKYTTIEGKLYIYDKETPVARYNVSIPVSINNKNQSSTAELNFTESVSDIYDIDEKDLRIYLEYDTVYFSTFYRSPYTYKPVKVRLK